MPKSDATTRGIRVQVESEYLEDQSSPADNHFMFGYHVQITNMGTEPVQLISRHWIITDANSRREEVKGSGVIGEQPVIRPGQTYRYSSFCPLKTPVGSMYGTYQMISETGDGFEAVIAPFTLAVPDIIN